MFLVISIHKNYKMLIRKWSLIPNCLLFVLAKETLLTLKSLKCYWWTQYNDVIWPFLMPYLVYKISDSWMNYSNLTLTSHSPCAPFRMQPPNNTPQTDVPRVRHPRVVWHNLFSASGLLKHWQAISYIFKHGVLFLKHDNRQILTRSSMLSC